MHALYFLFFSLLIHTTAIASASELNLFIWEDYISQEVIKKFQEKTGITINLVYFDSDQTRDEIMASSRGKKFDLVIFDAVATQIWGKNNLLDAISPSQVPNMKYVESKWQESCGNFGTPYFIGTVGIAYDTTKVKSPPDSWLDLLVPAEEQRGHVAMINDKVDILIPPLLYLGYNFNTEKPDELKEAYTLLLKQAPWVLNYRYALTNIHSPETAAKMHMALVYSGDHYTINEAAGNENWQYVVPREGTALWVDCMVIPAQSVNKSEALAFLNFINDPRIAAINTEDIYSASPIPLAREFVSEEAAEDVELFPSENELGNGQLYRIISDNTLRKRIRILDSLLKRHETQ